MNDIKTIRSIFPYLKNQFFTQSLKQASGKLSKQPSRLSARLPSKLFSKQRPEKFFSKNWARFASQGSILRRYLLMTFCALGAHFSVQASPVLAQTAVEGPLEATVAAAEAVTAKVNINTASAGELASLLNGIGGSKAEAIVRYREQFGPFESIDELSEVTGIGASTVERNRSLLSTQ